MRDLEGRTMRVRSTADNGVVGDGTRLVFTQRGTRVAARYAGGRITHGWLVGRWVDDALHYRYVQREEGRATHAGHATCEVQELPDGRVQLVEHFTWTSRAGSGVNLFEELPPSVSRSDP